MDGVVTGGASPPKSLDGPLIASARLNPVSGMVVSTVPSPFFSRNVTVTLPPGLPLADKSSPTSPASCAERCGTVCAPATEMSNSTPLATWQSVPQKASGCAPARWFAPGLWVPMATSLGFTSS